MDSFCRAREILSDYGVRKLKVTPSNDPLRSFVWKYQKSNGDKIYLRCRRCPEIKARTGQGPVASTHANGDFIIDRNPNVGQGVHSALNTFLSWLQKRQFVVAARIISLDAGNAIARQRKPEYIQLDRRISQSKQLLTTDLANIAQFEEPYRYQNTVGRICTHLRQVSRLLRGDD